MRSRKPIDGTKDIYIDIDGYCVDEYFVPMEPKVDENGDLYNMVYGKKRLIKNLVWSHFANNGKGAEIQEDQEPSFKDGDQANCKFDNLVIAQSEEDKKQDIMDTAEPEDDTERQIIALFVEDPDATYNDITERMKERHDEKVSRNEIASGKKAWKQARQEAGQV